MGQWVDILSLAGGLAGGANNSPIVWDVGLALPLLISDSTYIYIYGNGPIGMVDAAGKAYYYLRDGLGSVTGIVDSSGTLTATCSYVVSGTAVATFEYNADGLRTSMTVNGVRTNYLWDINESLPVILTDTNSIYIYGLILIARQTGDSVEYYHADALGSVRNLTNSSGQSVGAYTYLPFGGQRFSTGSSQNDRLFTGQQFDPSGLYYLRARYYDPEAGRFLTRDTIVPNPLNSQAWNRYAYVFNSPLRYTDPRGHDIYSEETLEFYRQIGEGMWDAAVDEITGVGDLLGVGWRSATLDEQQWAANRALAEFIVADPWGAGGAMLEGLLDPYQQAIDCGQYGKVIGRGTVQVATVVLGFKGASKFGALAKARYAARGMSAAAASAKITFGHGARHLAGTGLTSAEVEGAISASILQSVQGASSVGSFWGRVSVRGRVIEFRAFEVAPGEINVGTYYPMSP